MQLIDLMLAVADVNDPFWLKDLEDGEKRYSEAVAAVARFGPFVEPYRKIRTEREELDRRDRIRQAEEANKRAIREEIEKLRRSMLEITQMRPQLRGYALEALLNELFHALEIDSRGSFRVQGEQIDGAFSLDRQEFLVEAKWTSELTGLAEIDTFAGKIARKLDNTLGLFLSMSGFQPSAVDLISQRKSTVILMSGADLYSVLEGRIGLLDLLDRKRRFAAQTGGVFLSASDILQNATR